jgi:phosphoglycerol transferase
MEFGLMNSRLSAGVQCLQLCRLRPFFLVFAYFCLKNLLKFWHKYFPTSTLNDVLIYLNLPSDGVDMTLVYLGLKRCIVVPALIGLLICYLPAIVGLVTPARLKKAVHQIVPVKFCSRFTYTNLLRGIFFCLLVWCVATAISWKALRRMLDFSTSEFYEREFVEPSSSQIQFPHKKKNLVFIQVESLESDFEDKSFYGVNLMPDLQALEPEGSKFAHFHNGFSTSYTQGSLIAGYTGCPTYHIAADLINRWGSKVKVLPDYYSLAQILKDNGYSTHFINGCSGNFAGTKSFLQSHGVENVITREEIEQLYPEYTTIGSWGYGDADIFKIARQNLSKADKSKPYFLHLLTVDSHFKYQPNLPKTIDNAWYNAISHTAKEVAAFIKWLQMRKDYQDTVIVIAGDHLRMGTDFATPQHRDVYNLFIHAPTPHNLNRTFTQIDMFPTLLEAIGAQVKGHRLGLGTSLFSDEPTLAERFDAEWLIDEFSKKDALYDSLWRDDNH